MTKIFNFILESIIIALIVVTAVIGGTIYANEQYERKLAKQHEVKETLKVKVITE